MKKNLFLFSKKSLIAMTLVCLGLISNMKAADLVVLQGGTYSSISDAIAAATDDDRIIVTPISGGAPYTENLAVDKSLQFLSATEGVMFAVSGSIIITPADGRVITFIGMTNVQGSLDGQMSSPAGVRTTVNILNCEFESGNINLDYDYYNLNLASSIVNGLVTFRFGRVIGNEITTTGNAVVVNTDFVQSNDTIWITGNKIYAKCAGYRVSNSSYNGILFNSSSQYFSIFNNYVMVGDDQSVDGWNWFNSSIGININSAKNSNTGKNFISNNTVTRDNINYAEDSYYGQKRTMGINIKNIPANASVEAMNNLIIGDNSLLFIYGIGAASINNGGGFVAFANAGNVSTSYTYFKNTTNLFTGVIDNGTNNLTSNTSIGADGKLVAGSDGIDGGNADSTYYDIDLTTNDVGCYGGSFTLDNFFPMTGTARVYFVNAPRRIIVGNSLNIKAEAFDR